MRGTASIALAGAMMAGLTSTSALAADPMPQRISKFIGYVDCSGQRLAFDLVLNGGDRSALPGTLTLKQAGSVVGSYRVRGSIDNAGMFRLAPLSWINPAKSWPMIQVQGLTRPDGMVVAGRSTTRGCTKSGVVLASDDGIVPVLSAAYSVKGPVPNPAPLVLPAGGGAATPPRVAAASQPPAARQAPARALPPGVPLPPNGERTRLRPGVVMQGRNFDPYADYPSRALREELGGKHHVRLTIGPDGRTSRCDILSQEGETILAQNSCNTLTRRVRFRIPDQPGADVSGTWVGYIVYIATAEGSNIRSFQID